MCCIETVRGMRQPCMRQGGGRGKNLAIRAVSVLLACRGQPKQLWMYRHSRQRPDRGQGRLKARYAIPVAPAQAGAYKRGTRTDSAWVPACAEATGKEECATIPPAPALGQQHVWQGRRAGQAE